MACLTSIPEVYTCQASDRCSNQQIHVGGTGLPIMTCHACRGKTCLDCQSTMHLGLTCKRVNSIVQTIAHCKNNPDEIINISSDNESDYSDYSDQEEIHHSGDEELNIDMGHNNKGIKEKRELKKRTEGKELEARQLRERSHSWRSRNVRQRKLDNWRREDCLKSKQWLKMLENGKGKWRRTSVKGCLRTWQNNAPSAGPGFISMVDVIT